MKERFTYSTYIRCSPDVLWQALTAQEVTRQYWAGTWQESDWSRGSPWRLVAPDGRTADSGEVLEADRPNKLVISWRDELHEELRQEGHSKVSYVIEEIGTSVKLTVIQESEVENSVAIAAMSKGWPHLFASVKSLLETGYPLEETRAWPADL
ncbi:SRPBCC family protein (plasmid) [Ensifer sp. D2-11]